MDPTSCQTSTGRVVQRVVCGEYQSCGAAASVSTNLAVQLLTMAA